MSNVCFIVDESVVVEVGSGKGKREASSTNTHFSHCVCFLVGVWLSLDDLFPSFLFSSSAY